MVILLLSTYDLGRQPFGLASPAAWLRRAGFEVEAVDVSRQKLDPALVERAAVVAGYLPMHTATRLALPMFDRVRALNPTATLVAYGLYAPLNDALLREHGVTCVLGPEFESDLVAVVEAVRDGRAPAAAPPGAGLARLPFIQPDRAGLPGVEHYATLLMADGERRRTGSTDATRGCKHRCRHCPIVPVYDGQFRVVPVDVVLADIRAQVASGAEHITFADPDFLNGPTHARRLVEALHAEWPALTYDVTIKVEHLLQQQASLPTLAATGCLFVTSAVEAVDDGILARLEKGHTRADFVRVVALCREAGLTLVPTFVAFTPWTTIDGYRDLLDTVAALDLPDHVAPVQWGIRLLVTWQSRLLELADIREMVGPFDSKSLTYTWRHPDPRVDELQSDVMRLVGVRASTTRREIFEQVRARTGNPEGWRGGNPSGLPARSTVPYLDEPWYC